MSPTKRLTSEETAAGLAKAQADLTDYLDRMRKRLPSSKETLRERKDAVEHAETMHQIALEEEAAMAATELAARQAAAVAELLSDELLPDAGRQAIVQDFGDRVLRVFHEGLQALSDRDAHVEAAAAKARAAGLPEAVVPSWAFDPQHVEGFPVNPFRTGVVLDGVAVLPQPPVARQRSLFDEVVGRLTTAAQMPDYAVTPLVGEPRQDRPVTEARVSPRGEALEAAKRKA